MFSENREKEIVLPPGYEPVDIEEIINELMDNPRLRDRIREFRGSLYFLFDPENESYGKFLEQCKSDTKELAKALQQEIDKREMRVWAKGNRPSGRKRTYSEMNFLIRPPFLKSFVSQWDKAHHRMQKSDRRDDFVLHIDTDHRLQMIRSFGAESEYQGMEINERRRRLGATLELYLRDDFQKIYGQWEVIAQRIADAIQRPLTRAEILSKLASSS